MRVGFPRHYRENSRHTHALSWEYFQHSTPGLIGQIGIGGNTQRTSFISPVWPPASPSLMEWLSVLSLPRPHSLSIHLSLRSGWKWWMSVGKGFSCVVIFFPERSGRDKGRQVMIIERGEMAEYRFLHEVYHTLTHISGIPCYLQTSSLRVEVTNKVYATTICQLKIELHEVSSVGGEWRWGRVSVRKRPRKKGWRDEVGKGQCLADDKGFV